jgi:DNA helicase II / ATP-dependent DNA helicase PcrA
VTHHRKLVGLATAVRTIQDEAMSPRERADALGRLERMLQQLAPPAFQVLSEADFLQALGLSGRQFRERTLRLAASLDPPFAGPPSAFKSQLASQTEAQRILGWSTSVLRIPPKDSWPDIPAAPSDFLSYSTVHGYKGLQSPAVALVIPEQPTQATDGEDGVTLWSAGGQGEARNVLYVGASRAEQLLILVVHETRYAAVKAILDRDYVAYQTRSGGSATD